MEKEDGMSHVMVFFSIVIMVIVLVCGVFLVKKEYIDKKLETLKTNLVSLQVRVKVVAEEVIAKKEGISYIGKKISENIEDEIVKDVLDKGIIVKEDENFDYYYLLDVEDYKSLKVKNFPNKKTIVNYKTFEIIYLEGFKIKDNTYYKLSDFNNLDEEKVVNEELIVNEEQSVNNV